jgi:glycosyltransferase involved in cell wall biosynthesis
MSRGSIPSMSSIRLGITTQTPLVRQLQTSGNGSRRSHSLQTRLLHGDDAFHITPGGVTRMVLPELRVWDDASWVREAHWFSLQPGAPPLLQIRSPRVHLHHLSLPRPHLQAYARTKEKLWRSIHGIEEPTFDADDFRFYTHYNWFNADALLKHVPDLDVAYVHDFQLLQMGALIGLAAPSVFRWHVPFIADRIPSYTRNFLVRAMEDYDSVIVSTKRDLDGLHAAGFRGVVRQVYPHIDPKDWPKVTGAEVQALEHELGLGVDDPVIVLVARMDPIKRQDIALRAHARLVRTHPRAKLVLVGNGSFSGASGKSGGLGLDKSAQWARELQRLTKELGLEKHVVFAHWINDRRLAAVYERADLVLLTSDLEGFGLTIFEAWRYAKACIVSQGCGVSEVIHDGFDGFVFAPGDFRGLADQMRFALDHPNRRDAIGKYARESLSYYSVEKAAPKTRAILEETIRRFDDR